MPLNWLPSEEETTQLVFYQAEIELNDIGIRTQTQNHDRRQQGHRSHVVIASFNHGSTVTSQAARQHKPFVSEIPKINDQAWHHRDEEDQTD